MVTRAVKHGVRVEFLKSSRQQDQKFQKWGQSRISEKQPTSKIRNSTLTPFFLTFNPTGYSLFHWVMTPPGLTAVKAVAGVVLLIGWVMCLRATAISLGWLGVLLGAALLASLVWLLIELKMIDTVDGSVLTWIALVMVGILLGIGLSWSLIRARLMGHVEVQ